MDERCGLQLHGRRDGPDREDASRTCEVVGLATGDVTFKSSPWVEFGHGRASVLGDLVEDTGRAPWFVIFDTGAADVVDQALASVRQKRLGGTWEHSSGEPTIANLELARAAFRNSGAEGVIGIGGGSAMDLAKATAVLAGSTDCAARYQGAPRRIHGGVPAILLPTTAGSGSESTWSAVFINEETGIKRGINGPDLIAHAAVLDPSLTCGLPPAVTAYSGADALTHAIESYVAANANDLSEACSLRAIELAFRSLARAVHDGDPSSRADMMMAAHLGGRAIANAEVGLAHVLSYPLSRAASVPHGWGNAVLLPLTTEYSLNAAPDRYARIRDLANQGTDSCVNSLPSLLETLFHEIGITGVKSAFSLEDADWAAMVEEALRLEGPILNSPAKLGPDEAMAIYEAMP